MLDKFKSFPPVTKALFIGLTVVVIAVIALVIGVFATGGF